MSQAQSDLPQPSASFDSATVFDTIRPYLRRAIFEDAAPLLRDAKAEIEQSLDTQAHAVNEILSKGLGDTAQTLELLLTWMKASAEGTPSTLGNPQGVSPLVSRTSYPPPRGHAQP